MQWIASAAFGLEGPVKWDLKRLGLKDIHPLSTGGVAFSATPAEAFRANLWLRTADRVLLLAGRFPAKTFEALYEGVRAVAWEELLPRDAAFPVRAQCARSTLMSPSDCQSIAKKAIADRLGEKYALGRLPETGASYPVSVAMHNDEAIITLDSSGTALNRRGYRTWNGEAPIRETMAAALALISPWRGEMPLYDPCCGTGTLLIEAAFIAADRAPGLNRSFAMESWQMTDPTVVRQAREEARDRFERGLQRGFDIAGSDVDGQALSLAERHLQQAGLAGRIRLARRDLRDVTPTVDGGAYLTNPPYGERMGDRRAARAVAAQLGSLYRRSFDWSLTAISADPGFEKAFGCRAQSRRRLYNGRLECEALTFTKRRDRT